MSLRPAFGSANQFITLSAARLPAVDVRDYSSVDLTGAADSSAGLTLAFGESAAAGRALYLAAGLYKGLVSPIPSNLHLVGAGPSLTRFVVPNTSLNGIIGTGTAGVSCDDVTMEGITFDGDQANSVAGPGAGTLVKAYMARRWHFSRCVFKNGGTYGFSWAGYPGDPDPDKRGPLIDLYMEFCQFLDNGFYQGTPGVGGSDGLDTHSSERVVLIGCYAKGNSASGVRTRVRFGTFVNLVCESNNQGCDMNSHRPGPGSGTGGPELDSRYTISGGTCRLNATSGWAVNSTTGESDTHASLQGAHSVMNNVGLLVNPPTAGGDVRMSVQGGTFSENTLQGMDITGVQDLSIQGTQVRGNGSHGILLANQSGGVIAGNVIRGNTLRGVATTGTSDDLIIRDNDLRDNGAPATTLAGVKNRAANNLQADAAPSVASAGTITLPTDGDLIIVTGTTTISNITRSYIGRVVRLWFQASLTVQHNNTTILLNGAANLAATANDILELACVNANFWMQTSPVSAN